MQIYSGSKPSSRFLVILFISSSRTSHIRFPDEKAKTDFFENFQAHGIHPKLQVILSDFSNTTLPDVIQTQG